MTRALLILAVMPACYAPLPQPGSPCDEGPCPSGLVCSASTQLCEVPGGGGGDGGGSGDAAVAPRCFGAGIVKLCLDAAPRQPVVINGASIDTTASPLCAPYDGTGLCVVAGTDVGVNGPVRATGSRPLVLVAAGKLTISGTIDVASRRAGNSTSLGAGAMTGGPGCGLAGAPSLEGGGPGGSFGGRGGAGGIGSGGSAAAAPAVASVTALRGGCPGLAGVGTSAGSGGPGGGAVYLIALTEIGLTGSINASGAAGGGATLEGGGGGAGSGGMIGFDAPTTRVSGSLFANGGGGGEGSGGISGKDGENPTDPTASALGGTGGAPNGGDGGNGSAGAIVVGGRGGDNTGTAGGGGGGGGAGVIVVFGSLSAVGPVSPLPR